MKAFTSRPVVWALSLAVLAATQTGGVMAKNVSTPADQQSVQVTVYNSNLGLVKDVRKVSLPTGQQFLWFEGVSAQIDPTSVFIRSVTSPDKLSVLEQNFEYDLIEPRKLMDKYIGKTLELVRYDENGKAERRSAKLLGTSGGYTYEIDGKIEVNPRGDVVMPSLPDGLISRPSLVWMLDNDRKDHTVEVSYLTQGINWSANYVVLLAEDDASMGLSGWVTLTNQSGTSYDNATLKLVAGDVNRVRPRPEFALDGIQAKATRGVAEAAFEEESLFEYHLYELQRPTTVKNNQTKQVQLLAAEDVKVNKTFVYAPNNMWRYQFAGVDNNTKVAVNIAFENSAKNQLGMPIPGGVVRVFKQDSKGAQQFVGEDRVDHTPKDETIRLKLGDAFDVVAERTQTDYQVRRSNKEFESAYKIQLRNRKDENIVVQVVEQVSGDWKIVEKSHDFTKESAFKVRFDVPVKANSVVDVTYRVIVRY